MLWVRILTNFKNKNMKDKHLKTTSWYFKLTGFIWNIDCTNYTNFCPLFWLTLFSVIFSPILLIVKGLCYPFKLLKPWSQRRKIKKSNNVQKLIEDLRLEYNKLAETDWEQYCKMQYKHYYSSTPVGEALYYSRLDLSYEKLDLLNLKILEFRELKNQKAINKYIPAMKTGISYLSIAMIFAWLGFVVYHFITHPKEILGLIVVCLIIVVVMCVGWIIIFGLSKFVNFFSRIAETHCPGIVWKDKED